MSLTNARDQHSGAIQDSITVNKDGEVIVDLIDGVCHMPLTPVSDDRGTLIELFNPNWPWLEEPFTYSYQASLLPGIVKGWSYHKLHKDRYVLSSGALKVVLYDDRRDSPTHGKINEIYMSHHRPSMLTIPEYIWHASVNYTSQESTIVNFPTLHYCRENPDKYRLPRIQTFSRTIYIKGRIPNAHARTFGRSRYAPGPLVKVPVPYVFSHLYCSPTASRQKDRRPPFCCRPSARTRKTRP